MEQFQMLKIRRVFLMRASFQLHLIKLLMI